MTAFSKSVRSAKQLGGDTRTDIDYHKHAEKVKVIKTKKAEPRLEKKEYGGVQGSFAPEWEKVPLGFLATPNKYGCKGQREDIPICILGSATQE